MKNLAFLLVSLFFTSLFAVGCGNQTNDKPLKIGVTAGPHAEIMNVVKKIAANDGVTIQVIVYNDYIKPNVALNQGDLDMNSFQHQPYLHNVIDDRKYEFVSIAKTIVLPMGLYSKTFSNLTQVTPGSTVAIPNDPTNGGRAFLLLVKSGLITLKPNPGLQPSARDIADNPKNLLFTEMDIGQTPHALADTGLAVITSSYAQEVNLVPAKDALALEDVDSPYTNIIVVRAKDKDNPVFQKVITAYHSEEVKQFVTDSYNGSILPAW